MTSSDRAVPVRRRRIAVASVTGLAVPCIWHVPMGLLRGMDPFHPRNLASLTHRPGHPRQHPGRAPSAV